MAPLVLVCLDEVPPAPGGACNTTAWIEQPSVIPELSLEDAQLLSQAAMWAWVAVAAALLVKKAI
ncbi:MAG TPA: hypothetical protein VGE33_06020 [Thermomonas sp.]